MSDELGKLARAKNPSVKGWYGRRGGRSRREYICYICGCVIDTESARYPMTVHASAAIDAHEDSHSGINLQGLSPVPKKYWKVFAKAQIPVTKIEGVPCVSEEYVQVVSVCTPKVGERALLRMRDDSELRDALHAVALAGASVKEFLKGLS